MANSLLKQLLNLSGTATFVDELKKIFATKKAVAEVKQLTDPYILGIDYSILEFDTDSIISDEEIIDEL